MKKNFLPAAVLLSCAMTTLCLFRMFSLETQLQNMQNNLDGQLRNVEYSVGNISATVRSLLKEQASLLSDSSFTYGALDKDALTVEVVCSVTPKEFSPEKTTASLDWGELQIPLTLQNGSFVASLPVSLFSTLEDAKVLFFEDEIQRTTALDWHLSPRQDLLPDIYAMLSGSASGGNQYHRRGTISIDLIGKQEPVQIKSITLIEQLDGKEISRKSLPADPSWTQDSFGFATNYEIDETYQIPNGSTHDLLIEVVDQHNLHYRNLIDRWSVDQSGNLVPDQGEWMWQGSEATIYDANGRVLYQPDPSLYG